MTKSRASSRASARASVDLRTLPGHLIRRVHQLAVALFWQEVAELNLTPVQYSSLQTLSHRPGIDQKTLALTIGYDTSTIADVIARLEARGLIARSVSPTDRRARQLNLTSEGTALLEQVVPNMLRSQERLLEPLTVDERRELLRLMTIMVEAKPDLSNIPTKD